MINIWRVNGAYSEFKHEEEVEQMFIFSVRLLRGY